MTTFRKSKKVGPLRFTVSPRGLSTSGGVPGMRVSANTRGEVRRTVSIPGTGVYDTKRIRGGSHAAPTGHALNESPDVVVARLVQNLPTEQQHIAYDSYRADPTRALAQMQDDLGEAFPPELVVQLMPAMANLMARWTAS